MTFKFKINKEYLLVHALKQKHEPFKGWVELKNYLWSISPDAYDFLVGSPEIFLKDKKELGKITQKSKQLIKSGIKRKEFKRLYIETEKYKTWLEQQWNKNETKILKLIKEITKLKTPTKKINVVLTHPKLYNGRIIPDKNIICWGHSENWKNYSIVYLAHELMHIITEKKSKSNIMHALIELLCDNEIRIRLNKKDKYFKEGKYNIGHNYLLGLEKKILPKWKKFLKDKSNKNLFDLEKEIKKELALD